MCSASRALLLRILPRLGRDSVLPRPSLEGDPRLLAMASWLESRTTSHALGGRPWRNTLVVLLERRELGSSAAAWRALGEALGESASSWRRSIAYGLVVGPGGGRRAEQHSLLERLAGRDGVLCGERPPSRLAPGRSPEMRAIKGREALGFARSGGASCTAFEVWGPGAWARAKGEKRSRTRRRASWSMKLPELFVFGGAPRLGATTILGRSTTGAREWSPAPERGSAAFTFLGRQVVRIPRRLVLAFARSFGRCVEEIERSAQMRVTSASTPGRSMARSRRYEAVSTSSIARIGTLDRRSGWNARCGTRCSGSEVAMRVTSTRSATTALAVGSAPAPRP